MSDFKSDLEKIVNMHIDNCEGIADYLIDCLKAHNKAMQVKNDGLRFKILRPDWDGEYP